MLDFFPPPHSRPSVTNVHVEQKPHDAADAARLYGEIEAKAWAAITERMESMAPNLISAVVFQRNVATDQRIVSFKLNGTGYTVKIDPNCRDDWFRAFCEALATELMKTLTKPELRLIR